MNGAIACIGGACVEAVTDRPPADLRVRAADHAGGRGVPARALPAATAYTS